MTAKEAVGVAIVSVVFAVIYDITCGGGELCKLFALWALALLGM